MPVLDPRTFSLILNSLLLCGAVCAIALPVGTFLAWLLLRTDLPGRRLGLAVVAVMLFLPLYLQAAAWQAGFGLQGWHTLVFRLAPWLEGWRGAVWVHAMAAVPWVVLIAGIGFRTVEPELEEQALLDGSPRQVFFRVTLPAVLPALGAAAMWTVVVAAGEMTVTDLFAVRTYAEEIYTRLAVGAEPGAASLGVVPGVAVIALLVAAGLVFCAKLAPHDRPASVRPPMVFRTGRWRLPLAVAVAALLALLAGVPLGSLVYKAGVLVSQVDGERVRTWSAGKCAAIVADAPWRYGRELGWSLAIGALAAAAATLVAVPLAWIASRRRAGGAAVRAAVLLLIALCLAVPGPVLGLSIIWLLNRPEVPGLVFLYDRSILAPWLALWIRGLPAATLILWHAFGSVPRELLDGAALDGAGPLGQLVRVALPMRWPAVAAALLVALAVALGDLAASILVVPPGLTTLSIQIFNLLHYGVEDQVAGICLALCGLFAAAAAGAAWLARRWRRGEV